MKDFYDKLVPLVGKQQCLTLSQHIGTTTEVPMNTNDEDQG